MMNFHKEKAVIVSIICIFISFSFVSAGQPPIIIQPHNVSQLVNNAGYVNSSQVDSNISTAINNLNTSVNNNFYNKSSNINAGNYNITTTGTGFFGWLGSAINRITKGWFTNIDASGTVNATTIIGEGSGITGVQASSLKYVDVGSVVWNVGNSRWYSSNALEFAQLYSNGIYNTQGTIKIFEDDGFGGITSGVFYLTTNPSNFWNATRNGFNETYANTKYWTQTGDQNGLTGTKNGTYSIKTTGGINVTNNKLQINYTSPVFSTDGAIVLDFYDPNNATGMGVITESAPLNFNMYSSGTDGTNYGGRTSNGIIANVWDNGIITNENAIHGTTGVSTKVTWGGTSALASNLVFQLSGVLAQSLGDMNYSATQLNANSQHIGVTGIAGGRGALNKALTGTCYDGNTNIGATISATANDALNNIANTGVDITSAGNGSTSKATSYGVKVLAYASNISYGIWSSAAKIATGKGYSFWNEQGEMFMGDNTEKSYWGTGRNASINYDGTNLVFITNESGGRALAWFSNNISATGYLTRTEVFNQDALGEIKLANTMLNPDGSINHTSFGSCATSYPVTDYSRPIEENYNILVRDINGTEYNLTQTRTLYPYTKIEEGASLTCLQARDSQALAQYHQAIDVQELENQSIPIAVTPNGLITEDLWMMSKAKNFNNKTAKDLLKGITSNHLKANGDVNYTSYGNAYTTIKKKTTDSKTGVVTITTKDAVNLITRMDMQDAVISKMATEMCDKNKNAYSWCV